MIDPQFMKDNPEVDWSVYSSQQMPSGDDSGASAAAPKTVYDMNQGASQNSQAGNNGNVDISSKSGGIWDSLKKIPGLAVNAAEHPIDSLQDVGAGVMGGAQRLAALLGEGGQNVASFMTGGYAPRVNIREALGLEGDNQVKLEDVLASKNNNPLAKAIGQYGMGAASGGRSMLGQAASNAAWSGIQAEPGQRLKEAAIGGVMGAIPGAVVKAPGVVKAGMQYVHPESEAQALVQQLGKGATTAEENVNALAKSIQDAHKANVDDALMSKTDVIQKAGQEKIDPINSQYIAKSGKATELFDSDLRDLHETFLKDPTFQNADKLQSQLGNEIGYYQRMAKNGKLQPADKPKLTELKRARDFLNQDQDSLLQSIDPALKDQYQMFKDKWRENVVPYNSSKTLREMVQNGDDAGITRSQVKTEFAFPDKNIKKILGDIGQDNKDRILFNEVTGKEGQVADLAKSIMDAKNLRGYQQYVSPETEKVAENLGKRAKASKIYQTGKAAAQGAGIGLVAGHPLIGAVGGAAIKHGLPVAKYLVKHLKK